MRQAQEFYSGADVPAEAESVLTQSASSLAPEVRVTSLSSGINDAASTVSDLVKVALVVGGAFGVFYVYNLMKIQRDVVRAAPELMKVIPFL